MKAIVSATLICMLGASSIFGYDWSITVLEPEGTYTALAIGPDDVVHYLCSSSVNAGMGIIHYRRAVQNGSWLREVLPDSSGFGCSNDVLVDNAGDIHISYNSCLDGRVFYRRSDQDEWQSQEDVSSAVAVRGTSIALDPCDQTPCISFGGRDAVVYFARRDPCAGAWNVTALQTPNLQDGFPIARVLFEAPGRPAVAYVYHQKPHVGGPDYLNSYLQYAKYDGVSWSIEPLATWNGYYDPTGCNALTDATGNPWIIYATQSELRVVHRENGNWVDEKVQSRDLYRSGYDIAPAFDPDGYLHFAHSGSSGPVQHAWWDGSLWRNEIIIEAHIRYNSLVIDRFGSIWQGYGRFWGAGIMRSTYCREPIIGDLSGDCRIDLIDLSFLATNWLKCNWEPYEACSPSHNDWPQYRW